MKTFLPALLGLFGFVVTTGAASGAIYRFEAEQPLYELAPGETADVLLYLVETLDPSEASLIDTQQGLFALGINVLRQDPASSDPAVLIDVAANHTAFADPVLTRAEVLSGGASAAIKNYVPFIASDGERGQVDGDQRVFFAGIVRVRAGQTLDGLDVFDLIDDAAVDGDTQTFDLFNGTELDALIQPGAFEVRVVPEPVGPVGVLVFMALWAGHRRSPLKR